MVLKNVEEETHSCVKELVRTSGHTCVLEVVGDPKMEAAARRVTRYLLRKGSADVEDPTTNIPILSVEMKVRSACS